MITGSAAREVAEPARRGAELVAVLVVVALEPAGADAEHEATVAEVVDRARHVGEQVRVAVRVARHERADVGVLGLDGHRREQRVRLEVRGVGVAVQRVEVVPDPDAVDVERVGGAPRGAQVVDGRRLRVQLHADLEACASRRAVATSELLVAQLDPAAAVAEHERRLAREQPLQSARRRARRASRSRAGSGRPAAAG